MLSEGGDWTICDFFGHDPSSIALFHHNYNVFKFLKCVKDTKTFSKNTSGLDQGELEEIWRSSCEEEEEEEEEKKKEGGNLLVGGNEVEENSKMIMLETIHNQLVEASSGISIGEVMFSPLGFSPMLLNLFAGSSQNPTSLVGGLADNSQLEKKLSQTLANTHKILDSLEKVEQSTNKHVMMMRQMMENELDIPTIPLIVSEVPDTLVEKLNPERLFMSTANLYFLCPVTLTIGDVEPFVIQNPRKWIVQAAPIFRIGLKIALAVLSGGASLPFPLPDLPENVTESRYLEDMVGSLDLIAQDLESITSLNISPTEDTRSGENPEVPEDIPSLGEEDTKADLFVDDLDDRGVDRRIKSMRHVGSSMEEITG